MFEQRILCHKLPNSFNTITIDNNNNNNNNNHQEPHCINKRNKMIQDLKRQLLNAELEQYELNIQHYEHLYQQGLVTFQSEIYKTDLSSYQIGHLNELVHFVKIYVYHHTKLLIHEIRYKESCCYVRLLRHHRHRRQSLVPTNTIDVYPQIIVDVQKVSLNQNQLNYLSYTGKLVRNLM
jgi:hypothetical protein